MNTAADYWVCAGYADGPFVGRHLSEDGRAALCSRRKALHWGVKRTLEEAFMHDALCQECVGKVS